MILKTRRTAAFASALIATALCLPVGGKAAAQSADTILIGGKIVTLDETKPLVEALAVRGDTIVAVGPNADIQAMAGPQTRTIDLAGRTIIPGLIDSHIHAIRAGLSFNEEVHWTGARSIDEALGRLHDAAQHVPKGGWLVVAGGWIDRQFAEQRRPTQAEVVAAAPDHHIYVQMLYSNVLLSPGGAATLGLPGDAELSARLSVERDETGQPTGWLGGDNRSVTALFAKLPRPDPAQKRASTIAFFRTLNSLGITGVLDPGGYNLGFSEYDTVLALARDHALTLRVAYNLSAPRPGYELADLRERIGTMAMGDGEGGLRFNGIGENVTWGMYGNDAPNETQKQELAEVLTWAAQRGLGATFHWQLNRSVRHLLDVLERVNAQTPIAPLRWSIAHLNDATPESLRRMKALGVGWLMQNALYFRGEAFLGERGFDLVRLMPPIGTALRMGIPVGGGTDAHRVMSFNPFTSLQWMVDGTTAGGVPIRAPQETPSREQALRLYTLGSAWFAHDDDRRGSLIAGKLADFAVLSADYLSIPTEEISGITSMLTMVGGRIVFAKDIYAGFEDRLASNPL